jgi:hypothetical protein
LRRQASEQYLTSAQFFAQHRRQVIASPQTAHGLLGRWALLPRNAALHGAKDIHDSFGKLWTIGSRVLLSGETSSTRRQTAKRLAHFGGALVAAHP